MNIQSFNNCMSQTNFGAFIPINPDYLRKNCSAEEIEKLTVAAENIQNTKYYDLEVREDGFAIVNKETKEAYMGDLGIESFGPWEQESTWLCDNRLNAFKEKALIDLNALSNSDWSNIRSKYSVPPKEMSVGEKYVYYTDLVDLSEQRKIERAEEFHKRLQERAKSARENDESDAKNATIDRMMEKFGK